MASSPRRGQKPKVLLIGCCDSRVSPEVIFDADPGEIFVIRNVANLVPPYTPNDDLHGTSAALEFAVRSLKVEHIVVMGHASCGGVRAYAESAADPQQAPPPPGDFIGHWMTLIKPAAEQIGAPHRTARTLCRTARQGLDHPHARQSAELSLRARNGSRAASSPCMALISASPTDGCLRSTKEAANFCRSPKRRMPRRLRRRAFEGGMTATDRLSRRSYSRSDRYVTRAGVFAPLLYGLSALRR